MRLQRFGAMLFLVGVSTFVLLQLRVPIPILHGEHALIIAGIAGLGFGVVLMTLGTILRGASTAHKPEYRTDWHMVPRQGEAVTFGQAGERVYPSTTGSPGACFNCRKPLVGGAKFCPRCGAAASGEFPQGRWTAKSASMPAPSNRSVRPGIAPRTVRPFGFFRIMVLVLTVIAASYVIGYWQHYGRAPWEDWKWDRDLFQSTIVTTPNDSLPLPNAPDPRAPVASTAFQAGGCYIGQSSLETSVDEDGSVGIRVHTKVYSAIAGGLRFGIHLRFSDFGRVYSTDAHYRDANGQAATTVPVPASTGPVDVTAFIPTSSLTLQEGNFSLEVLASLYDASNRPIGSCQVLPFTFYRGPASITRIQLQPLRAVNGLTGPLRSFKISYVIPHPQAGSMAEVVVRFKDENGRTVPGHGVYTGPLGELRIESARVMATGIGPLKTTDLVIAIPASMIPPGATAEITVCNAVREAISDPVSFKMP